MGLREGVPEMNPLDFLEKEAVNYFRQGLREIYILEGLLDKNSMRLVSLKSYGLVSSKNRRRCGRQFEGGCQGSVYGSR